MRDSTDVSHEAQLVGLRI